MAAVVLKWADGEYPFALKARQIEHLEKVCNAGIQEIAERLFTRKARYKDIRETVHQGLIGGGMAPVPATEMMVTFFDGQPLSGLTDPSSPMATAQAIMTAAWFGVEDLDRSGEAEAGATPAPNSTSDGGGQFS